MSFNTRIFVVNNIKLPLDASYKEAFSVAKQKLKRLSIDFSEAEFSLHKKSVDARRKSDIKFVYSVAVRGAKTNFEPKALPQDVSVIEDTQLEEFSSGDEPLSAPPLIVGAGPCGLFSALYLAKRGYKPTLIERGGSISERKRAVEKFKTEQILNLDTNIQFGAGGAGTFSDGKLMTRINDPLSSYVLSELVRFGAPKEILYLARAHIGTDVLSVVVDNILNEIKRLGGKVLYNTRYISNKRIKGIDVAVTNNGEIPYGALVLAIGHSARDTYESIISKGFAVIPKQISVGMRIEHLAENIDKSLYGDFAGHAALGHAEYNLSYNTKERGVYTFCMCPGGEVVAAASEESGVVTNGMSYHARSGKNSNSAVVCSVFPEDYGSTAIGAIEFQRKIERSAFSAGGENYRAPIITVGDFLSDKCVKEPNEVLPTYMDGKTRLARPSEYLPSFVCASIKNALLDFDKKIAGFAKDSTVLSGAETRTSAPIRILRNSETRIAAAEDNIYPAGEGAGYAGGITSAAIDGLKTAIAITKRYKISR